MIGQLTNHVWQSTIFAAVAALLTLAFRKNRAQVRYSLWLSASLKFLIPFSLLMTLGSSLQWAPAAQKIVAAPAISIEMLQVSQPFPEALPLISHAPGTRDSAAIAIFALWLCGFSAIALIRFRDWRGIRIAVRSSTPLDIPAMGIPPIVEIRSSPGLLEPGVVGLFRPILLLPEGIVESLTPCQLKAVLAHELCHIRRRDNLASAIHMLVEALFWFHPLVWWIGARLLEERERACDEAVLRLGNEPHDYAEGILNVCKNYLESPLSCVSGVTGSNLKKRIQFILAGHAPNGLNFAKKLALAFVAIGALAVPLVVGIISAAHIRAQSSRSVAESAGLLTPKFEQASIKPCEAFRRKDPLANLSPGILHSGCTTLQRFIQQAYGQPLSPVNVIGGPGWTRSDLYQIDAKAEGPRSQAMMNGPMLQTLLEDRFKLKVHRETREVPVYVLTVAHSGAKLEPFQGTCFTMDFDHPPPHSEPGQPPPPFCAASRPTSDGVDMKGWTIADLCYFFLVTLDRPAIDQTGMSGRFNFHLDLPAEALKDLRHGSRGAPGLSDPAAPATAADPSLVSAIKAAVEKLGLNLEPTTGPGEFLTINYVQKPSQI